MKVYLTKQNRKTVDFILLEANDTLVYKSSGKVGKSGIANSTQNPGTVDKAIEEVKNQTAEYLSKGYFVADIPNDIVTKDVVFDKAKWHVNDAFPKELNQYQSYVHTGLYVAWLVDNNFYEEDFKSENDEAVLKHLKRQTSPVKFYELQLDGVFDAEGLTQEAIKFTSHYFDFENGKYLEDYFSILDPNDELPSLFHVEDSWENFEKLKPVLNERLREWRQLEK
jgi:hypothetical protein